MINPWMKKNPFMSMWLSGANTVAAHARNQMQAHGTRMVTDFWANALKTHIPGNFAGVNTMRDIPEFVRLIEAGRFDAKALVGQTFPLEKAREALQTAADRTAISAVVSFA